MRLEVDFDELKKLIKWGKEYVKGGRTQDDDRLLNYLESKL
jgi:hypothetical protein